EGTRIAGRRTAWVISCTGVSNEPRVLRQCEALVANGWNVVVCGFEGHSQRPAEWTFVRFPAQDPYSGHGHMIAAALRRTSLLLLAYGGGHLLSRSLALAAHRTILSWRHIRAELVRIARGRPDLKADLVIAHDYYMADTGFAIAKVYGAKFSID